MRRVFLLFVLLVALPGAGVLSGSELKILPSDVAYDSTVPSPSAVLGQEIARWHLRHDQLVRYFEVLAETSDRVTIETQGFTHEGRRQLLVTITSPANHARLEEIRSAHVALSGAGKPLPDQETLEGMPAVVYLGYSIHGNEASGSNASPMVAYHLAAARGEAIENLLDSTVVLIDPSLNPDGMGRFAQWANMHRGENAIGDPLHREHQEVWPGGRTNHYWFDLNRDWLLLQHPESRARVRTFHRWKPNLLGDYHEMGSNSTYFFQPGVPTREHPLKPDGNLALTRAIARFHARNLGEDGQLFYSEESFDDFYPGKGSTYPDLNGSVGILFEQASARGHLQNTVNGDLEFARAIKNHFLTSLSMLDGAVQNRVELLRYQASFADGALELARRDAVGGWVFGCPHDATRCGHMIEILLAHQIEVRKMATGVEIDGVTFDPAWSWVVPTVQPQYRLARSLFERRTEFVDSTFYDVSAWTLPLAFGADNASLDRRGVSGLLGEAVVNAQFPAGRFTADTEAYAYVFDWDGYYAPRTLHRLQQEGYRARVATKPFQALTAAGSRDFGYGTIVVPTGNREGARPLEEVLAEAARLDGVDVWSVQSGLTPVGVDLGSPSVRPLEPVHLLLVVGPGVSSYEAGEVWYLLDHRFGIPVALVEMARLSQVDLPDYTHVLMVGGSYSEMEDSTVEALRGWVSGGGVLVASKQAAVWAEEEILGRDEDDGEAKSPGEAGQGDRDESQPRYVDYEQDQAVELISGAIFEVELDTTHPMAFGYRQLRLPVFRNSTLMLDGGDDPYEVVARYTDEPLLAGYVSQNKLEQISGAATVIASRHGAGTVVRMVDDSNFRAIWYGTSKLYLNAVFFGSIVKPTSSPTDW